MFEKVTYTYYSDTLGRSVIPDEATFNKYKLLNEMQLKKIEPYLIETETDGIDSAVCMMMEVDYIAETGNGDNSAPVSSESVSGHSVSYDNSVHQKEADLNAKSIEQKKMDYVRLFCTIQAGVADL